MEKVTVNNKQIFTEQRGASILEVLLSIAVITALSPFLYNQISDASIQIRNISTAKKIIATRGSALNFVRMNRDGWPETAQIKLSPPELTQISDTATAGFIDKYAVRGTIITDVYLAFDLNTQDLTVANIAKNIGDDAGIVGDDGVAYGGSWAITAPDLKPGNLVYKIAHDFNGDDNSKYLHRGTSGEDNLNVMERNLNMGKFEIYDIGTIGSESGKITDILAAFIESANIASSSVHFTSGATMDGSGIKIGNLRVNGDMTGFKNITTGKLNSSGFSSTGNIIADRATINNSVNVGKNLTIKSDSGRTITGFVGVATHSVATTYINADDIAFNSTFGLTVSGELLMSSTPVIKIGTWTFPSITPPKFSNFILSRGTRPSTPNAREFEKIIQNGWRNIPRAQI